MSDPRPHPFAHELAFNSDYGRELQDEARAEQESPFCECDLELTLDELQSGRCACCGKAIV